ncbi:MAG: hypothetical protein Q8O05_05990 [Chloroflexota bacterium]|nr:hypothetical protein [Chloroflexota bacterium]
MPEEERNQESPAGEKPEVAELERRLAEQDQALAASDTRLNEAEARTAELEKALAAKDSEMADTRKALAGALASYRTLVVRANPDIPEELIAGDSIEAIDQAVAKARSLIARVKQGMEAAAAKSRVPAGAPQRTLDLSVLSPREKIQYGIGGKR